MSVLTLLILLNVILLSEQRCNWHHPNRCSWRHRNKGNRAIADYAEQLFEEVATAVVNIDTKAQELCAKYAGGAMKEIFELKRYAITTPLADFNNTDLKIEIRHRVMYINGYKSSSAGKYTQIIQLPAIVNTRAAQYGVEEETLKIAFALKNSTSCADDISDEVVNVPVFDAEVFSLRFGDDK